MSQTPRKPSRPTRPATSRPRRVAGQPRSTTPDAAPGTDDHDTWADDEPDDEPDEASVDLTKRSTAATVASAAPIVVPAPAPVPAEEPAEEPADEPGEPGGRGPLLLLVGAIVLLLVLGVGEVLYLRGVIGGDDEPASAPVSAARPVQLPDLDVRRVVDQAATAADLILSASSADYDAQVDKATATMTEPFAEEYRSTKADVKEKFVAAQTEVTIDISAQGVVTATDDEVVALLFLTQTTQKGTRGGVTPVQYRVTVTMVNTPDGWLVSDLEAL